MTCFPSKLPRVLWSCVVLAAWAFTAAPVAAQTTDQLFSEAQRYQLGVDRPQNIRKAIELYQRVAQMDPKHADARYNLAYLCFQQKRYDLAARFYGEVIRLQPDDAESYNNLGTVYERQGKPTTAMRFYQKAVELQPTLATAHYNIARLLLDQGKDEDARKAVEQAVALDPDNDAIVRLHAKVLGEVGRLSNAAIGAVVGGLTTVLVAYYVVKVKGKRT